MPPVRCEVTDLKGLTDEMLRLSRSLDEAQAELARCVRDEADADRSFRLAKANAYLATSGTVGEREAAVDKTIADERHRAHLAEGLTKSALEAVRSRRTQLSVLQSVAGAVKEELRFTRTAPEEAFSG